MSYSLVSFFKFVTVPNPKLACLPKPIYSGMLTLLLNVAFNDNTLIFLYLTGFGSEIDIMSTISRSVSLIFTPFNIVRILPVRMQLSISIFFVALGRLKLKIVILIEGEPTLNAIFVADSIRDGDLSGSIMNSFYGSNYFA